MHQERIYEEPWRKAHTNSQQLSIILKRGRRLPARVEDMAHGYSIALQEIPNLGSVAAAFRTRVVGHNVSTRFHATITPGYPKMLCEEGALVS